MQDREKTPDELIRELHELRARVEALESAATEQQRQRGQGKLPEPSGARTGELGRMNLSPEGGIARVEAAQALRESERRYRELAEMLPQTVFETDLAGRLVFVNRNAFAMFGYTQADLDGGLNTFEMIASGDLERARKNFLRTLHGEHLEGTEYALLRKDGTSFPGVIFSSPIVSGEKPVGLRGIIVDLTEQKQAARALEEAKQAAEAASKAKSEFLANMSHEIRTPMTAILGYADLLIDGDLEPDQATAHLETIHRNGEVLLKLINDILDLSKIEAGKIVLEPAECSPWQIVEEVVSLLRVRAEEKHLALGVQYEPPLPLTMRTDPVRLRQILVNLVGNAIKFTHRGGVKIHVRCPPCQAPPARLEFAVADTGIGVTPHEASQLFRPFFQADTSTTRHFGGTGLGLTISRRLAEILGGNITLASRPGQGSTFTLVVDPGPLEGVPMLHAFPAASDGQRQPAPPDADRTVSARVLLAEDSPDNQRLIRFLLEKAGMVVDLAENGRVACRKAWESVAEEAPYDLILMDIQMPELDGYEATRSLRNDGWRGPIIALTAHAMTGDRKKCLAAGCDDYVTKPIDRIALTKTISRHLCGAHAAPGLSG